MFGHDDVSVYDEMIFAARIFEDGEKQVASFFCVEESLAAIAARSYEMQVLGTVITTEAVRHGP